MKLLYDDDLVEAVVSLCASGRRPGLAPALIGRFHTERERCYAALDPGQRNAAFTRTHMAWFVEWGFADLLSTIACRFPLLSEVLAALAFRKARGRADEGAELYCSEEKVRQGVVALRADRFTDDARLARFLHHELAHLADMVDPDFGYSPLGTNPGRTASQERLLRERYRLLWNVSVDGRLTQRDLPTVADQEQRRTEFASCFSFLSDARRGRVFAELWYGRLAGHGELLELAADPRDLRNHVGSLPGASCPLCGFAAFEWIDARALRPDAQAQIRAEFPGWNVEEQVCTRCAEIYESIVGQAYPSTVLI